MRKLGKTGLVINELGFGGIPIQRIDQKTVCEMIDKMVELKINFIDTARGYTISESLLGNALVGKRDKFIIATKSMSRTYEGMKEDIKNSLKNLQTGYIDIYQLHNVSLGENYSGALKALEEAKKEGTIGHIGITTHSLEMAQKIVEENAFETLQFPYNIVEVQGESLFEKAKENNIGVIIMKPLAGGAITNAKLAIKYILNNENISVVIPGMESISQVIENVSVIDSEISCSEWDEIEEIKNELSGDFCRRCGYCMPCTVGINIPFNFLVEGYYTRYNLKEWAVSRYETMKIKPDNCIECGECERKCPYNLQIINKLKNVVSIFGGANEK